MADYQRNNWFATASYAYIARSNVTIDRYTYYTTEMHYTNEVKMPDASQFNFRAGYRSETWVAEAVFNQWTTLSSSRPRGLKISNTATSPPNTIMR